MISAKINTMTNSGRCPNPIIFLSPHGMAIEAVAMHCLMVAVRGDGAGTGGMGHRDRDHG
jgi:hypothetical protein